MIYLLILAALQIADIYTTHRILAAGGRELNPLLAGLFEDFGPLPVLIVSKGILLALVGLWVVPYEYGDAVIGGLCAFYAAIIAHNWRQLKGK